MSFFQKTASDPLGMGYGGDLVDAVDRGLLNSSDGSVNAVAAYERAICDYLVTGTGVVARGSGSAEASGMAITASENTWQEFPRLKALNDSRATDAFVRAEATAAERARIRAELAKLEPMEQPYSRRDWALEQKGEKLMYARVMRLFDNQPRGK